MTNTLLPQGAGYGILVGFGAVFALGMWLISIMLARFQNEVQGSEFFVSHQASTQTDCGTDADALRR